MPARLKEKKKRGSGFAKTTRISSSIRSYPMRISVLLSTNTIRSTTAHWVGSVLCGMALMAKKACGISRHNTYFITIVDDAIVHVATLLYKDVGNERIFTFAYLYKWNDVLAIFRKLYPDRQFDIPNLQRDLSVVTNGRAEDLLKGFAGHGWTNLELQDRTAFYYLSYT
ncbi:hypothetical protein J3F83DRAFT_514696 [Trichoderma novae-zelandiae]